MLSHDDEQRLAAIERQLLTDDPALARRLRRHLVDRRSIWQSAVAAVIGVLCALATVAGLLADSGSLILSGAALTAAAAGVFQHARRSRRRLGRPSSG
jgi:uncharacterized membrane protein YfcA